ncbi:MAG: hypothetical protein ACKO5W_03250, partial [Crocinitomicaceae bacterium]
NCQSIVLAEEIDPSVFSNRSFNNPAFTKTTKNINLEWFELLELGYQKTNKSNWHHYQKIIKEF